MKRILHVGVGPLGQRIIADIIERDLGQIVGAVDASPALAGKHLSELVNNANPKIKLLSSLGDVTDWDAVDAAIVTTNSDLPSCAPLFRELLAALDQTIADIESKQGDHTYSKAKAKIDRLLELQAEFEDAVSRV